jgi:hypothetical protein
LQNIKAFPVAYASLSAVVGALPAARRNSVLGSAIRLAKCLCEPVRRIPSKSMSGVVIGPVTNIWVGKSTKEPPGFDEIIISENSGGSFV